MRGGYHPLTGRWRSPWHSVRRTGKDGGKRKASTRPSSRPTSTCPTGGHRGGLARCRVRRRSEGSFDIDDFTTFGGGASPLDLGSVLIPMPGRGSGTGRADRRAVFPARSGSLTQRSPALQAHAAPKTGGFWREVVGNSPTARDSLDQGCPWGREAIGIAAGGALISRRPPLDDPMRRQMPTRDSRCADRGGP